MILVGGTEGYLRSTSIYKYENLDKFSFQSDALNELCDGTFSQQNIEILELIYRKVRFLFTRRRQQIKLYFVVVFLTRADALTFFKDIRKHPMRVNLSSISNYAFIIAFIT